MLQKLKRYGAEGGTLLWSTDYLSRGFGKCCLVTAPSYIGSSSRQPTWSSFICSQLFIEKLLRVPEEKDLGVVISDKLT